MADEFHAEALRGLCCACGVLIFKNGHELSSRLGCMSRTFNHLDVINMSSQISHICLRAGKHFLVKEEQGIPFTTMKIPLMWTPHSNNVKHANVINEETDKRRGQEFDVKGSAKVYRNVGNKQYTCFKSILFCLIM